MKTLRVIAFLCMCIGSAFSQTVTVSGHLITGGGAVSSSNVSVLWELINDSGQICKVSATGIIVPTSFTVTQAQLATGISLIPNNLISCGSTLGVNRWRYTVKSGGIGTRQCSLNITGTTNLDNTSCLNALPTTPIPATGDSLYCRIDGTNCGFTGAITGTSASFSGNVAAASLALAGSFSTQRILKQCDANKYSGADWSVQFNTAIADANCDVIDGSNLTFSAIPSSATVTINNNKIVTLPCGTFLGGASVNPVFQVNNFGGLIGRGRNCTVISTNSGTANIVAVNNGVNWWQMSGFSVQSAVARTAGAGIRVQGGNGTIEYITINPVFDGISFDTASVSNNNTVQHVILSDTTGAPSPGSGAAWHCGIKNGGVAVGTVSGNTFDDILITTSTAAFTDSGFCIQDGSDTIKIIGGQVAWGGTDSVGVHIETVNGGASPNQTQISTFTCEAGATKNCVLHDSGLNTSITGTTMQSSLRGMLINGGNLITLSGNTFQLNQQEGLRIAASANVTATGNFFSESSQQTTNTFSDIFVTVGVNNFSLNGNIHKDQFATGKVCKDGIEIAAGGSDFYSYTGDINNGNCGTAAIVDGGTGAHKTACNPGGPCVNGVGLPGFTGEYVAALTTTSGAFCFGTTTNCLDFGITTAGKYTFSGGGLTVNTGVSQGSGLKHQRFGSLCTTAASAGTSCTTAVTWTSAFADASYTVSCTGVTQTNFPMLSVESIAAAGFTIRIGTALASAATFATADCIAAHD